ncbi:MAG: radical SAM protein [Deltaproteobacteria bacterium]|nr:radical SAM protein [Deltaproteobacteria bacterium]
MTPARRRLRAVTDGVLTLGPQTVHLDITNACNTDCITCWDHSPLLRKARPVAWKRQRAEPAQLHTLLDDIQALGGLESVIVSGMGEPFTHPAVYDILADVKRRGLHLTVITNLVAADADRILQLGVDQLLIGVHGASQDAYLAFHPSFGPAHWHRLHAMLHRFRDAGRRFKHVQVIAACNAHELAEMVEFADRFHAAQVNFKLASLSHGTEAALITHEQRARLLGDGLHAAQNRSRALGVPTNLDVLEMQLRTGGEHTAPIEEVGCFLGPHYARVAVDGTVLYCCNTEIVVGKLGDGVRFSGLWGGPAWQSWRLRLLRGEYADSCRQCGKLNQNVKLSERFRALFGEDAWRRATGRGAEAPPPHPLRVIA